jgi:hypothetical protein
MRFEVLTALNMGFACVRFEVLKAVALKITVF